VRIRFENIWYFIIMGIFHTVQNLYQDDHHSSPSQHRNQLRAKENERLKLEKSHLHRLMKFSLKRECPQVPFGKDRYHHKW
jgi:hypothetical protein